MKQPEPFVFELGDQVRDVVTGITGIVTGRSQWITGCNSLGISRPLDEKGEVRELHWCDEMRCRSEGEAIGELPGVLGAPREAARTGGPQPTPQRPRG